MSKDGKKRFDPSQAVPRFSQEGHDDYERYLKLILALEPACAWIAADVSDSLFTKVVILTSL